MSSKADEVPADSVCTVPVPGCRQFSLWLKLDPAQIVDFGKIDLPNIVQIVAKLTMVSILLVGVVGSAEDVHVGANEAGSMSEPASRGLALDTDRVNPFHVLNV